MELNITTHYEMTWKIVDSPQYMIPKHFQGWHPNLFVGSTSSKPTWQHKTWNHGSLTPILGFYEATHRAGEIRVKRFMIKHVTIHAKLNFKIHLHNPPRFNTMICHWNHETMGEGGLSKEENAISINTYTFSIA